MASAHSPCPLCHVFTRSISLLIWTRSPTANGDGLVEEPDDVFDTDGCSDGSTEEALLSVVEELLDLVNTPGLNVHLDNNVIKSTLGKNDQHYHHHNNHDHICIINIIKITTTFNVP